MFLFELIPFHTFQTKILFCFNRDNTLFTLYLGGYGKIRLFWNFL